MERFDVYQYLKPTRFSAAQGLALVTKLLNNAPADRSALLDAGIDEMRAKRDVLEQVSTQRLAATPPDPRSLAADLGHGWMAISEALGAHTRIDPANGSGDASKLLRTLYPRGTRFVKSSHEELWAHSQHTLGLIETRQLEAPIAAIIGPRFVAYVRATHAAFAEALGVGTSPSEMAETDAVAVAIDDLSAAIVEYGRLLVGWLDWNDPAKVAAFKRAVAPLDNHRRSFGRSAVVEEEPEEAEDAPASEPIVSAPPIVEAPMP